MNKNSITAVVCAILLHQNAMADPEVNNQSGLRAEVTQIKENIQQLTDQVQVNTDSITTNSAAIANNTADINQLAGTVAEHSNALASLGAPATFDFHDYGAAGNVVSETYDISGNGIALGGCSHEIRSYQRTAQLNGIVNIDVTRSRTDSNNTPCFLDVQHYESRTDGLYWMGRDSYDTFSQTLVSTNAIDDGLLERTSAMQVGKTFGGASGTTFTNGTTETSGIVGVMTLLGVEDVTVPAGSFAQCLKISQQVTSGHPLLGTYQAVSWYCSGVGFTKRIDGNGNVWTLTGVTTN